MSGGVGTSGCVNISNIMLTDDSMREMIRSLNLSKSKYLMDSIAGAKVNANIRIFWKRKKLILSM